MKHILTAALLVFVLPACESKTERSVTTPSSPAANAPTTTAPATPPSATNQEPTLVIKVHPHRGAAPLDVDVNMCQSADPDGDPLVFEYKWGGTGHKKFTYFCREDHTYTAPGNYKAFFCVNDNHDHEVCHYELVSVS